ncbi:MAG: TIM barrel protein [Candidatus Micrarchaeia archaeon]
MALLFGTAGVPLSTTQSSTIPGILRVEELGLDGMEVEFVRQVYVKRENDGEEIKNTARSHNVTLSVHAPYFINLNSPDKTKLEKSKKRIMDSIQAAHWMGATSVVIHSAFYLGMNKQLVYERVRNEYKSLVVWSKKNGFDDVVIRPELMGKATQFADIDVLCKMCSEVEGTLPCVDFAHYYALHGEKVNNYDGFCNVLEIIEKSLGKPALRNMHIHFSGIEYTDKGERNHLVLDESKLKWKEMVRAWKEYKIEGIAISESPNIELDALKAKKYYLSL